MENLVTIIVAIIGTGIFNTLINYAISSHEKKKEKESGVQKASRLLMKTQLRSLCMHYIQQGWIYHDDLKGNGFLDEMMERVRDLEIRGIGVN